VYVLVPEQAGKADTTGADTVKVLPQLSNTVGAVGAVDVADGQATVEAPFAGIVTTGGLTV
jgi:hypothetical protein